ncbi:MAG: aminotransferase class I/II-fold pyridoxal phosphate-dependent enzyme, partial [Gammaproteobacteria bacterium]|nr:aminotransferase class I/II-fold pyridoxal phosphate-dependent enzyme [Gammaproteobacteria bacterium]
YSLKELKTLGDVLKQHPQIFIMTDDIYEYLLWEPNKFCNIVNAAPELQSRTIVVNGVSKAYAMTGWRLGYGAGPKEIIGAMKKIQSHSTSGPCSITQKAATYAIQAGREFLPPMLAAYQKRHQFMYNSFNSMGKVKIIPADGTFYSYIDITQAIKAHGLETDVELAELLLDQAKVAVVPGTAFGSPGHLRVSFATSDENLSKAVDRFKKVLDV